MKIINDKSGLGSVADSRQCKDFWMDFSSISSVSTVVAAECLLHEMVTYVKKMFRSDLF